MKHNIKPYHNQFHCDRQRTATPNDVDVFGTGIILPSCADLNQSVTGPCWPQLNAVLGSSGIKLSDPHYISSCSSNGGVTKW